MPVITASYVLTAEELLKFKNAFPEKNSFYLLIAGVIIILFALAGFGFGEVSPHKLLFLGLCLILLRPLSKWAQNGRIRQFSRAYPEGIAFDFEFSETQCEFSKRGIKKDCNWSEVYLIQQTSDYFLIGRKRHKNLRWLPRSAFASEADVECFLAYARQAKVKIVKQSVDGSLLFRLFNVR